MERRTFEDSLKDAFRDAEATPSDKVWTNVELELERESGGSMRRRVLFYQLLAAAAVTLALLASGVAYLMVHDRDETIERLLTATQPANSINDGQTARLDGGVSSPADQNASLSPDQTSVVSPGRTSATAETGIGDRAGDTQAKGLDKPVGSGSGLAYGSEQRPATSARNTSAVTSATTRILPAFYTAVIGTPELPKTHEADPVALMMARLAEEELRLASNEKQKKETTQEKVWTALGVAAGGFSAVNQTSAPAQRSSLMGLANTQVPDKQARASGAAYSLGLSFGTKVANRWVIQGGLNYLTQSSNYVATNVVAAPDYQFLQAESINALGKLPALAEAADQLAPTVPYSVNNNLKFFSVPMQAGYLLVNRKFGVQLNAGVSTDLFLENTITPQGGSLDKTTQGNGSDSPYRTVNFSGLMGTEFSYRIGQRYRVAINPALRYPFSSVYKSDVGIESMPLTFDVGLRFRYIFK